MHADLLKLYHRMPAPARGLVASIHGRRLRRWRYGPETDDLVEAALERDTWGPERWEMYQRERLPELLQSAARSVPYYRAHWAARRRAGDPASVEDLSNWPVLRKEDLRRNARAFLMDGADPGRLESVHTSGSTGTPLSLWRDRPASIGWYALFEARIRRWNGLSRDDRWAILGGRLVTPVTQREPPFWVWNGGLNQLYMSVYHLGPSTGPAYLRALADHRVRYLYGYASALHALAEASLESGTRVAGLAAAISNAEPLYDHQRGLIRRSFGCPVVDTYGASELAVAASECQHGSMHLWPDAGHLEVLHRTEDRPAVPGECGRFVCTGLLNAVMPLIRYEIGDQGFLAPSGSPCRCGRSLPVLTAIDGRMDDVILTEDGRRIGRLDPVFKEDLPIMEAQIVQEDMRTLRVLYVPAAGFTERHAALLVSRLRDRVGHFDVELEKTEAIPRSANGKFRAVVSRVTGPPSGP